MATKSNKVVMTKEMAEQLRGVLPISINSRRRFTPSIFLDKSVPKEFVPVFVLRPLTKDEFRDLFNAGKSNEQTGHDALAMCIESVENFWDIEKCEVVEFGPDYLETLDRSAHAELIREVLSLNSIRTAEAKGLK